MDHQIDRFESGQTTAEYAIMLTVISVGIIAVLALLDSALATLLMSASAAL